MIWFHCKNHILRLIAQKTSPQLLYGSMKFLPIGKILLSPFFEWAVNLFSWTPRRYSPTSLFKGFSCLCRGGPVCPPLSMISFDFGKTTAKRAFSRIFLEKSYPVASPGAHAGAPLQKLLKLFATDVGEDLCVLPVKINVLIFFGYDSKNHVFAVKPFNKKRIIFVRSIPLFTVSGKRSMVKTVFLKLSLIFKSDLYSLSRV